MPEKSLLQQLYRYVAFAWLLEEPRGDVYLRHALRKRNEDRLRRWTAHYMRVHLVAALLAGGVLRGVQALELGLLAQGLAACALGVEVCLLAGLAWVPLAFYIRDHAGPN